MNAAELFQGNPARADRDAIACGEQRWTGARFADEVRRSAGALVQAGVRPGERVLLLMRDTPEFAAAWLGIIYAGGVAVALNTRLSEAEYRHILADSEARLVIVEDIYAGARADLTADLAASRRITVAGAGLPGLPSWRNTVRDSQPAGRAHAGDPERAAFALYSSGTTGKPKGMLHSHRGLSEAGGSFAFLGIGESERVLATSKFFFSYGLEHGLLAPLKVGALAVLHPDWPDPASVRALVERERPTALFSVPTMYRRLLALPAEELASFRQLRWLVSAGERLSASLAQQWKAAMGTEIRNLYGMSETFCACMVTPPGTSDGVRTGQPLPGVAARLLDPEGREVRRGEPGVLWVRHPAQTSGYRNLPETTALQFRDGWFCTRDVFVQDEDGFYVHQGRSDDLMKIAGQWVQPADIEAALSGVDEVADVACVPVQDADGMERLALFVTPRGPAAQDQAAAAAAAACERVLPRHKRPKFVRVVEELPRTATGKVQRFRLREALEGELRPKG